MFPIVHSARIFIVLLLGHTVFAAGWQRETAPIPLVQATQVGATKFEPGDTPSGGHGQTIDGIEGSSREMLQVHVHAHLSLFLKGEQIAIPHGIGIVQPFQVKNGFVGIGSGIYWLHTHDATGIIHVESPDNRKRYSGDPRGIVLSAHTQITLEVGAPFVPPPVYAFPAGL